MSRGKKKELSIAERWRENHGSALIIIGLGVTIFGASILHLVHTLRQNRIPDPPTLGRDSSSSYFAPSHLLIRVSGFESETGSCLLNIFGKRSVSDRAFTPVERSDVPIADGEAYYEAHNLSPGIYYVSALHDINRDGVRNVESSTAEPYGYSNEASGDWDAPELKTAAFRLGNEWREVKVKLRQ